MTADELFLLPYRELLESQEQPLTTLAERVERIEAERAIRAT